MNRIVVIRSQIEGDCQRSAPGNEHFRRLSGFVFIKVSSDLQSHIINFASVHINRTLVSNTHPYLFSSSQAASATGRPLLTLKCSVPATWTLEMDMRLGAPITT